MGYIMWLLESVVFACSAWTASSTLSLNVDDDNFKPFDPGMPFFLGGTPEAQQNHVYSAGQALGNHTAEGEGLSRATTGARASFTIRSTDTDGRYPKVDWNKDFGKFIYVWIAGEDQILIAEVVSNADGTFTATYQSDFPGNYLIYVEDVDADNHDEGKPVVGSPFPLIISGEPTLDIASLPVCGAVVEDTEKSFWKPGTWVSSYIASASHGVTRDGWVFQPKTCTHDTFSFDDIMLLAGLETQTWLVILGSSVQRGIFLTLVDMALAQGQKDRLSDSIVEKCWGYANVQIGNLRLTYQDMRLFRLGNREDYVVCNNEKLVSGSTSSFIRASEEFLSSTLFKAGEAWPAVILAPSYLSDKDGDPNLAIQVPLESIPKTWEGSLLFVDHMEGSNAFWRTKNPTMTALTDVGITYKNIIPQGDNGIGRMESYRNGDSRVTFMSAFPMFQGKLFENQNTRGGIRKYAGSVHYHYVTGPDNTETYSGAKMVFSTMTEMLAHILIGKAVGTKSTLYDTAMGTEYIGRRSAAARRSFELCTDCPANLLPHHVKGVPQPKCEVVSSLPGGTALGEVWDHTLCPDWCMAMTPVGKTHTESGTVDVRECKSKQVEP